MFVEKFRSIRAQSAANRKIPVYRSIVPRIKGNQNALLALTFGVILIGALNISAVRAESVAAADQGITIAQSAPSGQGECAGRPPREALEACATAKAQSAVALSFRVRIVSSARCLGGHHFYFARGVRLSLSGRTMRYESTQHPRLA